MLKAKWLLVLLVTLSRLPLVGYGCWLLWQQNWLAAWLFIVGGMLGTDVIDGPLARKLGVASKVGAFADIVCDILAFYVLLIGWYVYTQIHSEFAQEWINWKMLAGYAFIVVITVVIYLEFDYYGGVQKFKQVKRWYTEYKGDFIVGVSVDAVIILWIAIHIHWAFVLLTVGCGLATALFNRKKVTGFVRSAFLLKGES